jgi:hypothetical protein
MYALRTSGCQQYLALSLYLPCADVPAVRLHIGLGSQVWVLGQSTEFGYCKAKTKVRYRCQVPLGHVLQTGSQLWNACFLGRLQLMASPHSMLVSN